MSENEKFKLNSSTPLTHYPDLRKALGGRWPEQDTAILVIHGIGNQNPLETLDGFASQLVETYQDAGYDLEIQHLLAKKTASDSEVPWFDNFLRIYPKNAEDPHLDIYEYYWAHETEGQATIKDLNTWLNNVTKGARKFYRDNVNFAQTNNDRSIFIQDSAFKPFRYWFCVSFLPQLFVFLNWIIDFGVKLLTAIPIIGSFVSLFLQDKLNGTFDKIANVLNDIAIYNTTDAKSRFFKIRNCILDGAVQALKYLLEARAVTSEGTPAFTYGKILLAGHSLGSQVAFDAINRLNHLVNQGEINGYSGNGTCNSPADGRKISERFAGLVTFGSPLDKIAFFFREQVADKEYLRAQIINNFHGFKQRDWVNQSDYKFIVKPCEKRLFDDVTWHNYWDGHDYVSGSLDYYQGVKNINCQFKASRISFTHSRYWVCRDMFADIIQHFLAPPIKSAPDEPEQFVADGNQVIVA
ncbi:hypothetical protein [Adhaeribacter pallidiroseus]|uniref:Uncharacterized protein n=1 Tax=Adhaeribacter pallidiroseus TaxID=2072847 RepID=A0A369QGW7_9BACT|nr:hypothetical protein [Adhaeribacter pallidiroseus]RDC62466.1 hypothetical protein AHMF7616_01060 [Adhaeribacter pallidiroseus]